MRRLYIIIILSFLFLCIYFVASYAGEDKTELKHYPPPDQYQKAPQNIQASKPILPPVVPSASTVASPTPSPHIAAPPVTPGTMAVPYQPIPNLPPMHIPPNIPSSPAQLTAPSMPTSFELPQIPVFGNSIGKVLNKGKEKDGTPWLEVQDQLFSNETIKIKLKDLKNIPIVKQGAIIRFEDIKIGDMINVMFRSETEENIANFIDIMTEEELKMMMEGEEEPKDNIDAEESEDFKEPEE